MRSLLIATAAALALAACSPTPKQPVSHIARVEPGDNALSCQQIKDKLDAINQQIAVSTGTQQSAATAQANSESTMTTLAYVPVVGAFAGLGMNSATEHQSDKLQATQDLNDATARRDNLTTLGNGKNCFAVAPAARL